MRNLKRLLILKTIFNLKKDKTQKTLLPSAIFQLPDFKSVIVHSKVTSDRYHLKNCDIYHKHMKVKEVFGQEQRQHSPFTLLCEKNGDIM